jgi:hypothetical protein
MPVEQLPTNIAPASRNKIAGSTWNRLAGAVNTPLNGYPILPGTSGPGMAGINVGGGMCGMPAQMTMVGMVIVTSIEDTCPEDTTEQDGFWAPCRASRKFLGKFRRWNTTDGTWVTTDEDEYAIDMGMFWPDETDELTSGPILLVDDIIPVWLDAMRGMLVPLSFPQVRRVILNAALGIGAAAEASPLKSKTTSPWWQKVRDEANELLVIDVWDLTLNNSDTEWEIGTKGFAVWEGNRYTFIPISCEPDDTGIE